MLVLITFFRNCKVLVNSERSIELTYTIYIYIYYCFTVCLCTSYLFNILVRYSFYRTCDVCSSMKRFWYNWYCPWNDCRVYRCFVNCNIQDRSKTYWKKSNKKSLSKNLIVCVKKYYYILIPCCPVLFSLSFNVEHRCVEILLWNSGVFELFGIK